MRSRPRNARSEERHARILRSDKAMGEGFCELQDEAVRQHCGKIRALLDLVISSYLT